MPQPLNVLIVEDSSLDAELLLHELRHAGFDPTWKRVEAEADYRRELHGGIDVVISDFNLPQFSGLRALELLKQSGLDVPFILVSGTIGEDLAVRAMNEGASDYLMKDRIGRLGQAVSQVLDQNRLQREGRRTNQALRENAAFIHDVINSLTAAVVVLDETGKITVTNEAWRRLVRENGGGDGLHEDYLTTCRAGVRQFVDVDWEAAREGVGAVLEGSRDGFTMEYPGHLPSGQRWFQIRVSPLSGARRGAVVTHDDITGLKHAEVTLRTSEERFRRLIENASDVIAVLGEGGLIEYASPSIARVLGYGSGELVGRPILELIHPEDRAKADQGIRHALADREEPTQVEYRIRHRDGSWRIFQSVGKGMTGPKDRRLVVLNSRDITETRKLEEQFLHAQRLEAIGTLSSGVAHDLNNILAPMLMVAPLLKDKLADPQDVELLTMIELAAQRGAGIVRQLLAFSRGVDGHRGPVQTRYLLKEMVGIMRETFPREITIRQETAQDLWPINADATQIHQVLMNLCVNARDAMRAGGTLTLTAHNVVLVEDDVALHPSVKPGPCVCLTVADTGEGIPRENLNRIFEPFFTTKEIGKGTGLGLSTVLGIVKSHGGFVTVDSESGRGTSFKVYVPAIVESTEAVEPSGGPPVRGVREQILIVDDEVAIRRALSRTLEENNYCVLTAADGREALTLFLENRDRVRVVLTDLMMPGMSGVALIRTLRQLVPKLRIIASSGLHDDIRREELAALGVTTILAKPCGPREILEAVQRELAGGG